MENRPDYNRHIVMLAGLSGLGIILAEILKKWELLPEKMPIAWGVGWVWLCYAGAEFTKSAMMKKLSDRHPGMSDVICRVVNGVFVVIAVLTLLSIPFIWFGTIEELAGQGG